MSDPTRHATEFAKSARSYYINAYPLTPDLLSSMAQQAVLLNLKLTQAVDHINSLLTEIDSLKNPTGESK